MNSDAAAASAPAGVEELDVLVVGAGLSGLCAAHYLQSECPGLGFAIVEGRDAIGGTWDLFRYPGVRSDSDMHTLAFGFRPWTGAQAIAEGAEILDYLRAAAREEGIEGRIRFGQRLTRASWDSDSARWTVTIAGKGGERASIRCRFLFMCTGYYDIAQGYRPHFEGEEAFAGTIVHPQSWPPALEHRGKRVLVIGSGATAMTLVPVLAQEAAHVCMVQRSPTWVIARPARDWLYSSLRRVLPDRFASRLARLKFLLRDAAFFQLGRRAPALARWFLEWKLRGAAGRELALGPHFQPRYPPWAQRLCLIRDGDLFACLQSGRASIETGEIECFTATGLRLHSGRELAADIIVTATGLKMELLQGVDLFVDGRRVRLGETLGYRGCMYSGIPNLVSAFGYSNASWTLRVELVCRYACRLLRHLQADAGAYCVPDASGIAGTAEGPMNLDAGYVRRASALLPRQGVRHPWRTLHNYFLDRFLFGAVRLDDGALRFLRAGVAARRAGD